VRHSPRGSRASSSRAPRRRCTGLEACSSASRWPSRSSVQNRARFCSELSLPGRSGKPSSARTSRGPPTVRCQAAPCPGTGPPWAARCHTRSHWRAASAQPRKIHIGRHLVAALNQAPTTRRLVRGAVGSSLAPDRIFDSGRGHRDDSLRRYARAPSASNGAERARPRWSGTNTRGGGAGRPLSGVSLGVADALASDAVPARWPPKTVSMKTAAPPSHRDVCRPDWLDYPSIGLIFYPRIKGKR
jgi:hypothetical protein